MEILEKLVSGEFQDIGFSPISTNVPSVYTVGTIGPFVEIEPSKGLENVFKPQKEDFYEEK